MAVDNFIPQVWSARTAAHLDKALVYAQLGIINRDYEGEIASQGDTVRINQIGTPTISSYTKNSTSVTAETLQSAQTTMTVDQADYFAFKVDDIDRVQANVSLLDQGTQRAAYGMADAIDAYVAGVMAAAVASANTIGTNASPKTDLGTAGNVYKYLVQLGQKLDEANVPKMGRWAILPPFATAQLRMDSTYIVNSGAMGDAVAMNGQVTQIAGFTVLESNNVPNVSSAKYKILAGSSVATTFANQISAVEAYRDPSSFSDVVRGLQLYGAAVVHPNALAMLIANAPS
jgi:N4-gp56 family major capsid protein